MGQAPFLVISNNIIKHVPAKKLWTFLDIKQLFYTANNQVYTDVYLGGMMSNMSNQANNEHTKADYI